MFTKAIVRVPGKNFADGQTSSNLGKPDYERTVEQHENYCKALQSCGLNVIRLTPDERHPDSTFVEDTAVLTARGAVIGRPGTASRLSETENIEPVLREHYEQVHSIQEPGTLDGGDVCQAGEHFFTGISRRTNEAGAKQLAALLDSFGYSSSLIDIRSLSNMSNVLHLKSGLAYLGDKHLVVIDALRSHTAFSSYELICLNSDETYAANCISLNGRVAIAASFPAMKNELEQRGYRTITLEMSEFEKMDGGLSCLSLRF